MTHNDHIGSPVLICIFIFKYYFKNVVLNQEELITFFYYREPEVISIYIN